jgi:hypothetical protein
MIAEPERILWQFLNLIKMKNFISLMIGEDFKKADIIPALVLIAKILLAITIISFIESL